MLVVGLGLLGLGFALGRSVALDSSQPSAPDLVSAAPASPPPLQAAAVAAPAPPGPNPSASLVYYPFMNLRSPSGDAVATGELLLAGLVQGDRAALEIALESYRRLQEVENFAGEYPTLEWFCEFELADPARQREMLEDDDGRRFVDLFGRDDWALLVEYVSGKYRVQPMDRERLLYLDELIRFNSPYRERWERTDRVLELLAIEPGMEVVDVGAGAGFFSFRISDLVGRNGTVYAVEINDLHLEYMRLMAAAEGMDNLIVVPTDGSFPALEDGSVDRVFLCAAYQALYLSVRDDERTEWLEAASRALAPGGLLVVAENEPVLAPGVVPTDGISVSRPLLEAQLLAYGFELVAAEYVVPQRYVLVLRRAAASAD